MEDQDINRILGGIYIGSINPILNHTPLKAQYNITHILSIIKFQTLPEYLIRKSYTLKNIPIDDDNSTDILQYFDEANRFIDLCLFPNEIEYDPNKVNFKKKTQQGAIYIHCHAGISRSAAFSTAYLMYRYGFDLKTALYAIKRKRPIVEPNSNFLEQLNIYEKMEDRYVSNNQKLYNQWKLANSAKSDPTNKDMLSKDNVYDSNADEKINEMSENELNNITMIRCKKCRQKLALSTSFVKHVPPSRESSEGHFIKRSSGSRRIISMEKSQDQCSHFFVDPLNWMKEELQTKQNLEGKFFCPNCKSKVGGYNWKGSRCSCGKWMVPAIHLQTAKVDEVPLTKKILPNVVNFTGKN